jgi:hypothetical protein
MSHLLPGLPAGPVKSTDPPPAATPDALELPKESAEVAAMLSLPERVLASPSVPSKPMTFEPPSLPDAKSTFGNEHEYIAIVTASRAGIAHLAMGDGSTQFSF